MASFSATVTPVNPGDGFLLVLEGTAAYDRAMMEDSEKPQPRKWDAEFIRDYLGEQMRFVELENATQEIVDDFGHKKAKQILDDVLKYIQRRKAP